MNEQAREITTAAEPHLMRYEAASDARGALTPFEMLNKALAQGADIAILEKLMGLHERFEAANARKAFDNAIAEAKGEIPPIAHNRRVKFDSKRGGSSTDYTFEDLAGIAKIVDPILRTHGLSYRYRSEQAGKKLRVTCILSHRDGYYEETTLEADEDHSGNKNSIQAIGSAATYLQRYTLKLALGLSTAHSDDDGRAGGSRKGDADQADGAPKLITEDQVMRLRDLLEATGRDEARFLRHYKLESLSAIWAENYKEAETAIRGGGQTNGR